MELKYKVFLETPKLKAYMKGLAPSFYEDFYQDFYLIIEKIPNELADKLHKENKLIAYYCRIIFNELTNKKSRTKKTYRSDIFERVEIEYEHENLDLLEIFQTKTKEPKTLEDWYAGTIATMYIEHGTVEKVSNVIGCSKKEVSRQINKFRTKCLQR